MPSCEDTDSGFAEFFKFGYNVIERWLFVCFERKILENVVAFVANGAQ